MRHLVPKHCLALLSVVLAACVPSVEDTDSLVTKPRVLAVRAKPAEAAPRADVSFEALYADASGTLSEGSLDWAFCIGRKSLAELGPVNPACLREQGKELVALGEGLDASAALPEDGCRLFGPNRPAPVGDEPAGRPADPDPTGGFYQPVRLIDPESHELTLFDARILCGLAGVTQAQAAEFAGRYRTNENPSIDSLEVVAKTSEAIAPIGEGDPLQVKPGQQLKLRLSWSACTDGNECGDGICGDAETREDCAEDCSAPKGCGGSEYYAYFDGAGRKTLVRREALGVSWFAIAGTFEQARTGRSAEQASQTHSDNVWTAPSKTADVTLWTVLRDDRGGVTWQSYAIRVAR
jgi:hypothetical protein